MRDESTYGIIYLVTNKVTHKKYVGQTVVNLQKRWRQHCHLSSRCSALANAIQKYGEDAFSVVQIDVGSSAEELNRLEAHYVEVHGSLAPRGYNLKDGGGATGRWSQEVREKIVATLNTPAMRDRAVAASVNMWQREETRKKISDSIRVGLNKPEVRERRSKIAKEAMNRPEVLEKIRAGQKRRYQDPAQRARVSELSRARSKDPAYIERMREATRQLASNPEYRAAISSSLKERWRDPEYRARMTAAQQAGKARKKAALLASPSTV